MPIPAFAYTCFGRINDCCGTYTEHICHRGLCCPDVSAFYNCFGCDICFLRMRKKSLSIRPADAFRYMICSN